MLFEKSKILPKEAGKEKGMDFIDLLSRLLVTLAGVSMIMFGALAIYHSYRHSRCVSETAINTVFGTIIVIAGILFVTIALVVI